MRRTLLGSLALLLVVCTASGWAHAQANQANEPVKPFILFVTDVSGSMRDPTNFGSPSCASTDDTRLDHLKCALQNIVAGYGSEMIMGLGRFRLRLSNTPGLFCVPECVVGIDCTACEDDPTQCQPLQGSGDRFELLVPLVEQNQEDLLDWVNFTCGTCAVDQANDPELFARGFTPIAGSLKGAKRYFQGLPTPGVDPAVGVQPYWPTSLPGADPIRDDPLKDVFAGGQQCRPYIVIMLTDGDETCVANFSETTDAAAALLSTQVDGQNYRIVTKPIGFGKNPGDAEIEALAHAGGAVNGPGFEGFYAQNEEELAIAIAQIISQAQKFETCNELDDDCDLLIDEDFPNKGAACDNGLPGICQGTGALACSASGSGLECVINNPGQPATTETCNGLDDDCDAKIDEGNICVGCLPVEFCDNVDNDCDGVTDEDLTRPCGTDLGECTAGIETCVNGSFQNCTAVFGSQETCDGLDNDCNGIIDGFFEPCSNLPGGNPDVGICQPGTRVCPSDGSGTYGSCLGEVAPRAEACDLTDNDCDTLIDESTGGDTCNGQCGPGVTECVGGAIVCNDVSVPGDEVCDAADNDCDGLIDENLPPGGSCTSPDGPMCAPGQLQCIAGQYQCVGAQSPEPEVCDCTDNDCDGETDEPGQGLCPAGAECVSCQCAFECQAGEFPCPPGLECVDNFCVTDLCYQVECLPDDNGDITECVAGDCVRSCDLRSCPPGQVCRGSDGLCVPDNCSSFPEYCSADELCIDGACVADPCNNVDCEDGQYCREGTCIRSCADVDCPTGQRCVLGQCQPDPCGGPCGANQVCSETSGNCVSDPCIGINCPSGLACNPQNGRCETDPCLGITCPGADEICIGGSCYTPDQLTLPDAGPTYDYVTPAGGGGCSAGPGQGQGGGAGWILLVLVSLLWLCRREQDHA